MATENEIKYLEKNFDYNGLKALGFYGSTIGKTNYDAQIKRICDWFGIANIFQYDAVMIDDKKSIKADVKTFSQN